MKNQNEPGPIQQQKKKLIHRPVIKINSKFRSSKRANNKNPTKYRHDENLIMKSV